MLEEVVVAQMLLAMVVRVALVVAVLVVVATIVGWLSLELPTQAVARVETEITERLALVVLVSLFCLFQLLNTQAQPQAHQLSQQAVQTQF
jgi:uncharacterized membrane protein